MAKYYVTAQRMQNLVAKIEADSYAEAEKILEELVYEDFEMTSAEWWMGDLTQEEPCDHVYDAYCHLCGIEGVDFDEEVEK